MKKHLLFVLSLCFALVTTAADLNPFAYGLSSEYDPSTFTLTINYSLNAPATSVDLVIIDSNGAEAGRIALPGKNKGTFSSVEVDLSTVGLVGGEYSWKLDVTCNARSAYYEPIGRVKKLQSPFSVDVDNNPNSPYFGRIYVSQPTTNATRGIYVYTPGFTATVGTFMGNVITVNTSESWYTYIHAVPYRIRVVQDGTGRILTTSSDRDQSTHLWLVDPANMTNWTTVITSANLRNWTNHNNNTDIFANTSLDIRKSDDGQNWELLLYSASVNSKSTNHSAGYIYSGIYTVPINTTDFKGGTYTNLTKATGTTQHSTIDGEYTGSMITANAQFDKYGGVLYSSYSISNNTNGSSLIHKTKSGAFKTNYTDETYLYRQNVATGAIRFNHDFTRLAIAQGSFEKEARFYTVTQAQASDHIALSARKDCDMIPSTIDTGSDRAYVIDFAWDYAQNVYAVVRNGTYAIYGVYAMAANLGGTPVSTPAKAEYKFEVDCPDRTWNVNVSGQVDGKTLNTDLGECALQINGESAAWNTTLSVQACNNISVKVTKDNKHKFAGWYNGETLLTKEEEYSFYAVKDINLVAKFEFAEYNVVWYNLFQNDKDITDYITNPNSEMDGKVNARLWRLFQWQFNTYSSKKKYDQGTWYNNTTKKSEFHVVAFLGSTGETTVEDFMTTEGEPFYWLGKYILLIANKTSLTNDQWKYHLYSFFNRTNTPRNSQGTASYGTTVDFSEYGKPTHWRRYWTEYGCKLVPTMTYGGNMPIKWECLEGPNDQSSYVTDDPRTWYKWNPTAEDANKLLAWRYGDSTKLPSAQTLGPIVHNAYQDGALFATWVDKHLDENDSKEDGASNEDVIKLMKNTKHTTETESFTVTRKLVGGMYNTICMPFTLRLEGLMNEHPLYGAKAYDFSGIDPLYDTGTNEPVTVLNFTEVTTLLPGKPYLIVPEADVTEDMPFTGVRRTDLTLEPESKTVTYGDNELTISFHGVINPTDIPAGALMVVADNRLAVNTVDNSTMKGMRGYFTIDFSSLAAQEVQEQALDGRVYLSFKKPVTTSVPLAPEAEQPTTPKVEKIMRDGQIYIIRDGVTYTITGARVRNIIME